MAYKVPEPEGWWRELSTLEDMPTYYHPRHQQRIVRMVKDRPLTTNGVQWSTWVQTTSTPTSKTSNYIATVPTTVSWPGLEEFYLDEMEAGLTCALLSTSTAAAATNTTMGYRWEYKDASETTWTALSTFRLLVPATSTGTERTLSGYAPLGTGYNKIPMLVRLRAYARGGTMAKVRIKNSSYVAIKPKKQA